MLMFLALLTACGRGQGDATSTWSIEGPLQARDASVWIIDTVPIVVPAGIAPSDIPAIGALVAASGDIGSDGQRVARNVSLSGGAQPVSTLPEVSLSGPIESIADRRWVVGGREIVVPTGSLIRAVDPANDATVLIQVGTVADIVGNTMIDDKVIAREIVLYPLDQTDDRPVEQEQPSQPAPDPPASHDGDSDDGDDGDDDEVEDRKEKDKADKPGNGNGNGRDKDEND